MAVVMPPLHCHASDLLNSLILHGRPERLVREELVHKANQKVEWVRNACGLNAEETEKLKLVAMGDVDRAMNQITALRHATEDLSPTVQADVQKALLLLQPFQNEMQRGFHEEGSLFARYLKHSLSDAQRERYEVYAEERKKTFHHLFVLTTVSSLNDRVPLLKSQREKLIELIDSRPIPNLPQNAESYSAYVRLANVPKEKLKAFLDEEQASFIIRTCERYQMMGIRR
ncbi:MAG: hypothetical protein ACTHK7_19515 [Aureliella sp.]